MPLKRDTSERSVEVRGGIANHVVGGVTRESDEQSLAGKLNLESRAAQVTGKLSGIIVQFDPQEFSLLREFRERASVLEFPLFDRDEVIANPFDLAEQVRRDDDRDAELAAGTFDEREHFFAAFGIEAVGGLVEEEEFGIVDERLREFDALLHAGGVGPDESVALFVESDMSQCFGGTFACGGGGEPRHAAHVGHEVGGGHIYRKAIVLGEVADELSDLERMGERVDAEDFDRAGGRGEEAEEDADEGGLAGAVGSDQADDAIAGVRERRESRAVTPG